MIYSTPETGTHIVNGGLLATWNANGAENGWLGYPTTDAVCGLAHGGCKQSFQTGIEYWSPAGGAHPLNGALRATWDALGSESSWLGYPTSDAVCRLWGNGCMQSFQYGAEYWSPATGTHPVNGALRATWAANGAESGWMGYPTSDAVCGLRGGGCLQTFQTAAEYWSPASGAHPVNGALRSAWAALGSENSWLGYPTSDAICGLAGGGCKQAFQTGMEYWMAVTGTHTVNGALRAAWEATGAENGPLLYPVTDARCDSSGCLQTFELGSLFWSSATGRVTRR
jgi:uncharacterized protein with LGFP repeats